MTRKGARLFLSRGLFHLFHTRGIMALLLWRSIHQPKSHDFSNVGHFLYAYEHFHISARGQNGKYRFNVSLPQKIENWSMLILVMSKVYLVAV